MAATAAPACAAACRARGARARRRRATTPGWASSTSARRLGVDKSQASRTLRALAEQGLAERDAATRAYRLGPRVFAYAALVAERRLLRTAPPVLARLVASAGRARAPQRARRRRGAHAAVGVAAARGAGGGLGGAHRARLLHGRRPCAARRPRRGGAAGAARRRRAGAARAEHGREPSPSSKHACARPPGAATRSRTRSWNRGSLPSPRPCAASTARSSPRVNVSGPAFRFARAAGGGRGRRSPARGGAVASCWTPRVATDAT